MTFFEKIGLMLFIIGGFTWSPDSSSGLALSVLAYLTMIGGCFLFLAGGRHD